MNNQTRKAKPTRRAPEGKTQTTKLNVIFVPPPKGVLVCATADARRISLHYREQA